MAIAPVLTTCAFHVPVARTEIGNTEDVAAALHDVMEPIGGSASAGADLGPDPGGRRRPHHFRR